MSAELPICLPPITRSLSLGDRPRNAAPMPGAILPMGPGAGFIFQQVHQNAPSAFDLQDRSISQEDESSSAASRLNRPLLTRSTSSPLFGAAGAGSSATKKFEGYFADLTGDKNETEPFKGHIADMSKTKNATDNGGVVLLGSIDSESDVDAGSETSSFALIGAFDAEDEGSPAHSSSPTGSFDGHWVILPNAATDDQAHSRQTSSVVLLGAADLDPDVEGSAAHNSLNSSTFDGHWVDMSGAKKAAAETGALVLLGYADIEGARPDCEALEEKNADNEDQDGLVPAASSAAAASSSPSASSAAAASSSPSASAAPAACSVLRSDPSSAPSPSMQSIPEGDESAQENEDGSDVDMELS